MAGPSVADPGDLDLGDPLGWRPMRPYRGRRVFEIRDPVAEPFWSGTRVLCHATIPAPGTARSAVVMIEELGADVAAELPSLRDAVAASIDASDAVIDGVISKQVGMDGVGAASVPEMQGRPGLFLRSRVHLEVIPRGSAADASQATEPIDGFIALDLLRLDGISLLDVPLLERKRLLESVIRPGDLARTSAHVRPPIETWIATWKSLGLRGGILKAANSRYRPGEHTTEWRIVESVARGRT
jgi:bifunctional non-homologous end joining protein LigD